MMKLNIMESYYFLFILKLHCLSVLIFDIIEIIKNISKWMYFYRYLSINRIKGRGIYMKKLCRAVMYCIGLVILAVGIILNTKTGLGVSPIISIPYCISNIWGMNLGNATLCVYILCVMGQMVLRGKKFRYFDLLQIPMSVVFSIVINVFNDMIIINFDNLGFRLLLLAAAIILTGIGVAISVEMKFVPNAADGLTQALAEKMNKGLGFAKNMVDVVSVTITLLIGLTFGGKVIGIGIGTLAAVLGVGRSIALVSMLFKKQMSALVN